MLSQTLSDGLAAYRVGPKIRRLRKAKRLGLAQLGEHTGLTAGTLSRIERGQMVPTLPTLLRIALVFGVGLDHFFASGDAGPLLEISRKADRVRLPIPPDGRESYRFESLDYAVAGRSSEAYLARFPPGAVASAPHAHDGVELLYVVQGWVELTIHGRAHRLNDGDCVTFDADFDHAYRGEGSALVVVRPAR